MAQERHTLEEAIAIARELDVAERMKLRKAIDDMIAAPAEGDPESPFKRRLLERGLISEIRLRSQATDIAGQHRPVPVKGKPVSETIIEDRR